MKYLRCIKSNRVSQDFGANIACIYPETNKVTTKTAGVCPIGSLELYPYLGLKSHNGFDRIAWHREPVYFPVEFNGWVKTEVDSAGGVGVDVVSNEPILKCIEPECYQVHYIKWRAWHHWEIAGVHDKQQIKMGHLLAFANSSGLSSGTHVHESPKWCNKDGVGIHENNGWYGAFDPRKHPDIEMVDKFVIDYLILQNIEAQIKTAQLTFLQVISKYVFILREQIRGLGDADFPEKVGAFLKRLQK